MTNLDDMFSVFASLIVKDIEKGDLSRSIFASVERAAVRTASSVSSPREAVQPNSVVSWLERVVFDIRTENVQLPDCDIVTYSSNGLAIVNIGIPQHPLLCEQIRDFAKEGLIWNMVLEFFTKHAVLAAKVAVEDSFSLETLNLFRPGDWNVFRNGRIPDFLSSVKPRFVSDKASFYTREQVYLLRTSETEMGLSFVRALSL